MTNDPAAKPKHRSLQHRMADWLGSDLDSRPGRRRAWWATHLLDHAFLRKRWHNFHKLDDGVYRSNQPTPKRVRAWKEMGIRTVLSLRGNGTSAVMAFHREACAEAGLSYEWVTLGAKSLAPAEEYLKLLDLFDRLERPFVMHCKSGADRTGIASAFYLIDQKGVPAREAMAQLGLRYLHRNDTKTGILDHMLRAYATDGEDRGTSLRDWLANEYDRDRLTAEFSRILAEKRPIPRI